MANPINPAGGDPAGGAPFDLGDGVGGDPGGGDPGGDGGGEGGDGDGGDPSLESAAAEFEAELLGSSAPGGTGEGDDPTIDPSDPLEKFIRENYAGDRHAVVAGFYDSRNEGRRLAQRVNELEAKLAEGSKTETRDVEAEYKAQRDGSAVVRNLDQEIQTIESDVKQLDSRQLAIVGAVQSLDKEIDQLEGKLSREDDPIRKSELREDIREKKLDRRGFNNEFTVNDSTRRQHVIQYKGLKRDIAREEKDIREEMAYRTDQATSKQRSDERTVSDFNTSFGQVIKTYDVDMKSEKGRYLYHSVKEILAGFLQSRGNAPALDTYEIQQQVSRLVTLGAKAIGAVRRSPGTGTNNRPGVPSAKRVGTGSGNRPAPRQVLQPSRTARSADADGEPNDGPKRFSSQDDILSDPDAVRKRAQAVFSAQAKATRGRGRLA